MAQDATLHLGVAYSSVQKSMRCQKSNSIGTCFKHCTVLWPRLFLFVCFYFCFGVTHGDNHELLRNYSILRNCSQKAQRSCVMPGIYPRSAAYKAKALPGVDCSGPGHICFKLYFTNYISVMNMYQ